MLLPNKNSYKEFYYENKFLRLENSPSHPPPPHNFSNGPSLNVSGSKKKCHEFYSTEKICCLT